MVPCRFVLYFATLAAVADAQGRPPPISFDQGTFSSVRILLTEGQFARAASLLEPFTQPPDALPKPLYLLALVRLQEGALDKVQPLIDRLRIQGTSEGAGYADALVPVLTFARHNLELHADFADALRRLDGVRATEVLRQMDIPDAQRAAVSIYLDVYRGRLASAVLRLGAAEIQPLRREERDALRAQLVMASGRFSDLSEQLRWYTESSLATSACQPADARERSAASGLLLAEYVRLTELGLQLFPLNDQFMDEAFHGALLSTSYEDLQRLGEDILKAKGTLRIPFYSSTSRFWLVIDVRAHRLFTELDHIQPNNLSGSEALGEHVLFTHAFSDVTAIHQRARNVVSTGSLARDSYALKVDPRGQAPHFLFMSLVHCLYGEETQKQITRNLGRFIQHVVGQTRRIDADLENPSNVTRDRLQLFSQIVGTTTVMAANAAEQLRRSREMPEVDDGRISTKETLQQTAREGASLMTRRSALLKAQAEVSESQRASSRSWSESLADSALGRGFALATARVDDLVALAEVR